MPSSTALSAAMPDDSSTDATSLAWRSSRLCSSSTPQPVSANASDNAQTLIALYFRIGLNVLLWYSYLT